MKYLIMLLLLTSDVYAQTWFCTEESSRREKGQISACGVGAGTTEDQARLDAANHAKAEFDHICNASSDCKDHEVFVEPRRTTCEQERGGFKCYRLIVYLIGKPVVHQKVEYAMTNQDLINKMINDGLQRHKKVMDEFDRLNAREMQRYKH